MRVFLVGATGLIGSHAARAIQAAGHGVAGLARSDEAASRMAARGWTVLRGDVDDTAALACGMDDAEIVIFAAAIGTRENAVVGGMLDHLAGSGKSFILTSGTGVLGERTGGAWSEDTFAERDDFIPARGLQDRVRLEQAVLAASGRGLARGMVVRSPAVWTHERPHFLISQVVETAQAVGAAPYVGEGLDMYSHVHAEDLGEVFRHVAERGTDGAVYHAVAGEVPNRWIAEAVAGLLGCGTRSLTMDEAIALWGKFNALVVAAASSRSRSPRTRAEFGWAPRHTDMLAAGLDHYRAMLGQQSVGPAGP